MKSLLAAFTGLLVMAGLSASCRPLTQPIPVSLCDSALPDDGNVLISSSAVMASDNIEYANVYDPTCPNLIFNLDRDSLSREEGRHLSAVLYSAPNRNAVTALSEVTLVFTGTVRREGKDRLLSFQTVRDIKHRAQILPPRESPRGK